MKNYLVVFSIACSFVFAEAKAQYPSKPIQVIANGSAGGWLDLVAREFTRALANQTRQRVILINRPGGQGKVGANFVSNSKPDGYTLLFHEHVSSGRYSGLIARNLESIAPVAHHPMYLHAKINSRLKRYNDLVNANTEFSIGFTNSLSANVAGSITRIHPNPTIRTIKGHFRELLQKNTVDLLVSGQRSLDNYNTLAKLDGKSSPIKASLIYSVMAPRNIPSDVRRHLRSAINNAANDNEFQRRLSKFGPVPIAGQSVSSAIVLFCPHCGTNSPGTCSKEACAQGYVCCNGTCKKSCD